MTAFKRAFDLMRSNPAGAFLVCWIIFWLGALILWHPQAKKPGASRVEVHATPPPVPVRKPPPRKEKVKPKPEKKPEPKKEEPPPPAPVWRAPWEIIKG